MVSIKRKDGCILFITILCLNDFASLSLALDGVPIQEESKSNLNPDHVEILAHSNSDNGHFDYDEKTLLNEDLPHTLEINSLTNEAKNEETPTLKDVEDNGFSHKAEPLEKNIQSSLEFDQELEATGEKKTSNTPADTIMEVFGLSSDTFGNNEEADNAQSKSDHESSGRHDHEPDVGIKKQRYFSLLYTFGTLFNSFMSEFGDVSGNQDIGYNSSEKEMKNSSVLDEVLNDANLTLNSSESGKKSRFQCALRNLTESTNFEVKIVNSTELLEILNFSKNQKLSPCVLVMFYAPWCSFCARTAPHYNALARAFPQLNVLAVDTSHFSYLNARFGTVAVPNVMLFHSRSAVRFNHTTRDLDHFCQFITNNTGLEPNKSVSIETWDYEGPLSSQVVQKRDWLLWLAWTFVIVCSTYFFVGSLYGQAFIAKVRVLWQEHQHIE